LSQFLDVATPTLLDGISAIGAGAVRCYSSCCCC